MKRYLARKMREYMVLLSAEKLAPGSKVSLFSILKQHLTISSEKIDDLYSDNSSILAFWMAKHRNEAYKLRVLERQFERKYAAAYTAEKARSKFRTSEGEIKMRVVRNAQLSAMQDRIDAQKYRVDLLKDVVEVMRIRNDNVINLGASLRTEQRSYDSTRSKLSERMNRT